MLFSSKDTITMSSNAVTLDVLVSFVDSLSAERQKEIGDISDMSPGGGYERALDALHASGDAPKTEKKERAARDYRVFLLNESAGTFEDLGVHKGSPGRAHTDPSKMSALQKIEKSAEVKSLLAARKGIVLTLVKVAVGED